MTDQRSPSEIQRDNIAVFMEDGPRLSYRYGIFVVAKDERAGRTKLGGLGAMGVGQMWVEGLYSDLPGYDKAPSTAAPPGGF